LHNQKALFLEKIGGNFFTTTPDGAGISFKWGHFSRINFWQKQRPRKTGSLFKRNVNL
jgi:hypothetical protein